MKIHLFHIRFILLILTGFLVACSPTRRISEGQYLLVKNHVVQTGENKKEKDDIASYIQQKPNSSFLGIWRFYLQVYNLPNPQKVLLQKEKQQQKLEKKINEINTYNASLPEGKKKKSLPKERLLFGEWLQKIGEEPVVLDSFKLEKSRKQLELYARSKGFFRATVRDSVVVKNKKAEVYFIVNRGPAYYIDTIKYIVPNPSLDYFMNTSTSLLSNKMKYDMELLDEERERLTTLFKDQGYYLFKKEFIHYEADSLGSSPQHMNITLEVLQPDFSYVDDKDTILIKEHRRFRIRDINVITDFQFGSSPSEIRQQEKLGDYTFFFQDKKKYNHRILSRSIFFSRGTMYNLKDEENTQRSFSEYKNFRYINVRFVPEINITHTNDWLDCVIELTPASRQNIGVDLQGTNTEGNLGVSFGVGYQNRNTFNGAEMLEFRINAGAEIQVLQGDSSTIDQGVNPFNTIEAGAQLSLLLPRFLLPIKLSRVAKWVKPKSRITFSFNMQQRPDFKRYVSSFLFGYEWQQSVNRSDIFIKHGLNPVELSLISIDPNASFTQYIESINDQFVKNSFKNHFILGTSYTFLFNSQQVSKFRDFVFFRFNAQTGGNFLKLISTVAKDTLVNGYHQVFNIQYAQYVRAEADFRYYKIFNPTHNIAFRAFIGVGLPYGNSTVLPFEKSFFIGGANDLRAWLPRTLGPGSFAGLDSGRVDQVGDIKLLANIEYRIKIYRFIEAALFADAGNIWLIRKDGDRLNGEFSFDRFYREFALGGGAGIRLNLGFFIFRVDFAIPLRDPTKPIEDRWVVTKLKGSDLRVNIGIGYPF